ncbi:hypothetical protein LMG27952_01748 [Paraburkholderia hiiakae]|uniref:DNA primase/helicase n=1 Tax=Paraburkholderia hiiakae TaxID=1081782 RepID=A0ABN7HNU7_9BURK|nr:DUF927 domain-containing protein [Paraburkholderia hiiakae]CAD6524646.1 hypothetical protein LMG27952_01748 [Paraburkholderia hiiakae]
MADTVHDEFERARIALGYIPPDDRETWRKVGMALKTEFGDEAFPLWDEWSRGAQSYKAKAARDSWKSFKGGGITVNTLFHIAKGHGFDPRAHKAKPIDPAERKRRDAERAERETRELADAAERHEAVAAEAARIWEAAGAAPADHPYLKRKAIQPGELRLYRGPLRFGTAVCDGALIVPACDTAGKVWTLELILVDGQKRYLRDGQKAGHFASVGGPVGDTLLIAEGYATASTLAAATGLPCAVAFDVGNLLAVAKALRGQHRDARIVLCADDDYRTKGNPGVTNANAAAAAVGGVVAVPDFGDKRPSSGTDFNDLAAHRGVQAVAAAVRSALATRRPDGAGNADASTTGAKPAKARKTPRAGDRRVRFEVDDEGVWYHGVNSHGEPLPRHKISSRLDVVALTRNELNGEWGYLLEFADPDGVPKRWAMPAAMLAGDGSELRRELMAMGLDIRPSLTARQQIVNYIQSSRTEDRARCVPRIGWYRGAFVLPDRVIGDGREPLIHQSDTPMQSQFRESGTLDEWRREVAAYCVGNSRLLFCVSVALAGPLLHFAGLQSGGFHLLGSTSEGKSTGGAVAASVYGSKDYVRGWRATDNALEAVAAQHADTVLILDEIGQVEPRIVGDVVYMLANEAGKSRGARAGGAKPVLNWRLLFLSNGEKSIDALMAEGGRPMKGGIEARLPAIPADAGRGMGAIEELHGFDSSRALVEHLKHAASRFYGMAGPAMIQWASEVADELPELLRAAVAEMVDDWIPRDANAAVARVAERFALVGVAGELATAAGITAWPKGEAEAAARACLDAWIKARGGTGSADQAAMLRQVVLFFEQHGDARFVWVQRMNDDHRPNVMHRAGFKRLVRRNAEGDDTAVDSAQSWVMEYGTNREISDADADRSEIEYLVSVETFRSEICRGFDHRHVERVLIERGVLMPESSGRATRAEYVPTLGKRGRYYRILPSIHSLAS